MIGLSSLSLVLTNICIMFRDHRSQVFAFVKGSGEAFCTEQYSNQLASSPSNEVPVCFGTLVNFSVVFERLQRALV